MAIGNPRIDETDFKILQALSENSRISLKKLAQSLRLKTNRLQYRIDKLVEQGIISSYTSVINPDCVELNQLILARIISSSQNTKGEGKSSARFLEGLAKIILKDFDEVMFASVGYDEVNKENILTMIFAFYDSEHQSSVFDAIKENPLVEEIQTTDLGVSGINHRLYTFTPQLLDKRNAKLRNKLIKAEKEHQRHALDLEEEEEEEAEEESEEDGLDGDYVLDDEEDFEDIATLALNDDKIGDDTDDDEQVDEQDIDDHKGEIQF